MSNRTVYDCIGVLVDSENGPSSSEIPTPYDHNENYTFTICVEGSESIELIFSDFQTEICCDHMFIYDGPDPSYPQIGEYYGSAAVPDSSNVPGTVRSTGECITIVFRTDGNIVARGWEASWNATPPEPEPPVVLPIPNVTCESTTVEIEFDEPIPCSELTADKFTFGGPAGGSIANVTPINCGPDLKATRARITFASPLNESGTYCFSYDFIFIDKCDRPFQFEVQQCFNIIDCPLEVYIEGDTNICSNGCGELYARVSGGNPANYQFDWTPNAPNNDTILVCPNGPVTYTVTVTDGTSQPATATFDVDTLPPPTITSNDTAVCRYSTEFFLSATPAGGFWGGSGTNSAGRFRPYTTGPGTHSIVYYAPNGCTDTMQIEVWDVRADRERAACVGAPPFTMTGQAPGGTWSGPNITPDGVFTPPNTADSIYVEYTEPINGCVGIQRVVIVDSILLPPMDSILVCTNENSINMNAFTKPVRGNTWSGAGINAGGIFNPELAGEGIFVVYCAIEGCSDSTNITVSDIDAGNDTILCPSGAPIQLISGTPVGGTWSGPGVVDNGDGTFSFNPNFQGIKDSIFFISYDLPSCSDSIQIFNLSTKVNPTIDTIRFCPYDDILIIDTSITRPNLYFPGYARVFGPGIVGQDSLDPSLLATGFDYIYYEFNNNGCIDSLAIEIKAEPTVSTKNFSSCPQGDDIPLFATPTGGNWSGFGVNDTIDVFSPSAVPGLGQYRAVYDLRGCKDTSYITLETISPKVVGVDPYFCYNNVNHQLTGVPAGGTFSMSEVTPSGIFNPSLVGPGMHDIAYQVGSGQCIFYDTIAVSVLDSITLSLTEVDTNRILCFGDSVWVRVNKMGGLFTADFSYTWSADTLPDSDYVYVKPIGDTSYTVIVDDGCSFPASISFNLNVHPEIAYTITYGDSVCYGDTNWAKIEFSSGTLDDYTLRWDTPVPSGADSISTIAGKYNLDITALETNCKLRERIRIPHHPYIKASFIRDPLEGVHLDVVNPLIRLIDNSAGASWGYWLMGDSQDTIWFDNTLNLSHLYPDTGTYTIKLWIINDAYCADSIYSTVIVDPVRNIFLPNAFTPNNDGDNDFFPAGSDTLGNGFLPTGYGLIAYEMEIFDRWGHLVYESGLNGPPWNGRLFNLGAFLRPEVYVYRMVYRFSNVDVHEVFGSVTLLR